MVDRGNHVDEPSADPVETWSKSSLGIPEVVIGCGCNREFDFNVKQVMSEFH